MEKRRFRLTHRHAACVRGTKASAAARNAYTAGEAVHALRRRVTNRDNIIGGGGGDGDVDGAAVGQCVQARSGFILRGAGR